ncbi:DUF1002 domain-containing protein [Lactobacillus sp. YT155]|uniref:DUF1002 domain-containing protein n=1 Tax=Lactobacillus sp. YT155 TaxID=3060955 RepID=UPI00265FB463|nr:DUF1002 domain-containing protein [Lactobacillus sp. YT155]MDO1605771.1 DUF1002 domain-containing protein [Lactobacillus sp. YT155]
MKKTQTLIITLITLLIGIFSYSQVNAAELDSPVMTLGSSLTQNQRQGTIDTLSAKIKGENYSTITVTGDNLVKYLNPSGSNFTSASGVWSSALIVPANSGSGINVTILNYNGNKTITTITENQYRNAALTAGISDANIYVTSATPIDGSGALAGIYSAYSKNGESLNQSQVTAAQDEMNTLSEINQENKGKDGYTDQQLNNAIAGAKSDMADKGPNITVNEITNIVNTQINNNGLQDSITTEQRQQIITVLTKVRDSGALKNSNFKDQAKKLSNDIQKSAANIFDKLNTKENRNFLQKLWDNVVSFFTNLF